MSSHRPGSLQPSGLRTAGVLTVCLLMAACLVAPSVALASRARTERETAARPPVPASLTALESNAEDIVDVALAHDRARVIAMAGALKASAGSATGRVLLGAGAVPADIAALRTRAALVARISRAAPYTSVALAANAVSELVVALYAHFADPVPVAVRRLDYLDREAQLRSLAGQRKAVAPIVARLAKTWAPLRPAVIDHHGQAVAAAYGRHVVAMQRLADAPGGPFRSEAVNGLNIVDELETVFSR
jgi:hypothetical protein